MPPPSRISPPPDPAVSSSPAQNAPHPLGLTPAQLSTFNTNGYLILPDYLPKPTVSGLLSTTHQMLDTFSLTDHPLTRFSTGSGSEKRHVGDAYFLTSGDKIRFFFEEDAFSSDGKLSKPKSRAINKIGHNLHGLSPAFASTTHTGPLGARNAAIAHSLGFKDPRVLQSMIICKQPEIGGAVPPHQDSTFLYTRPPSAVGFWIALEDATRENGCLGFARGSHRRVPVRERFVRVPEEGGTGFVGLDQGDDGEGVWPRGLDREEGNGEAEREEVYELREVKAGTLVLIHGNLLHKSERNTSGKSRFIYTFHVIEGAEGWIYDERNWLQPLEGGGGFTRLFGEEGGKEL